MKITDCITNYYVLTDSMQATWIFYMKKWKKHSAGPAHKEVTLTLLCIILNWWIPVHLYILGFLRQCQKYIDIVLTIYHTNDYGTGFSVKPISSSQCSKQKYTIMKFPYFRVQKIEEYIEITLLYRRQRRTCTTCSYLWEPTSYS